MMSVNISTDWPALADIEAFEENGFLVGPQLLGQEELTQARHSAEMLASGYYNKGIAPARCHEVDPGLRKWKNSWWADSVLESLATSRVLGRIAARLLRAEEIFLWEDHLIWKDPGAGSHGAVGWHQDKHYWQSASEDRMLTAIVALDECIEENGCLRFVPGSHKWGLVEGGDFYTQSLRRQSEQMKASLTQPWQEISCILPAGHVSFHHCLTIHSSAPNVGREHRRVLAVHLMAGTTTLIRGKGHLNETLVQGTKEALRGNFFPQLWPVPASPNLSEYLCLTEQGGSR